MTTPPKARTVRVAPDRLEGWLDGFAERHGVPSIELGTDQLLLRGADGAAATFPLPWGPLVGTDPLAELVAAARLPRRVGALVVRRRAHAVGLFDGERLLAGRHGSHYVQGRTKAGGWSQQRYARRRANQADRSFEAAASDAAEVLLPHVSELEALACGGDRAGIAAVLADPRLEPLRDPALRRGLPVFAVPDPNAGVLAGFPALFRQVPIELNELA